jgi:Bacteriophage head to tail connecting protein
MTYPNRDFVMRAFERARKLRSPKEDRFDQAMRYAMPGRGAFFSSDSDDEIDDIFDETAIVATQEFASRLQAGIVPNFTRWAKLKAGLDIDEQDRPEVDEALEAVTEFIFEVLNASNFPQESAECFMDLAVTLGCLEVEKGTAIEPLRFNAIPINELYVNNGPFDKLDQFFRVRSYSPDQFEIKFPGHTMPADRMREWAEKGDSWDFIDAVMRDWEDPNRECHYRTLICKQADNAIVWQEKYDGSGSCPIIAFRWGKEAGSVWGRGPLMNAMPAIKTCNLVVQMVLENAQMSISGIYNMDDDGTVNVDTIELVPGTIIPRAPGSRGVEAVAAGGNFNVAGLVLDEQRANIKRALYNDMLGNPNKTPMSATEVAERMADLARQIGSAFGRLMGEFIFPVMQRVVFILKDLGTIKLPVVNGREVKVTPTSPLARAQDQEDISNVDRLIVFVQKNFGPQLVNLFIKGEDVTPYVGEKLGVPTKFIRKPGEIKGFADQVSQMGQNVPGLTGEAGVPDLGALTANQPASGQQGAASQMPVAANAA